ncbi:Ethylene-responsive transcription factor wri1 [Pleodorina starrii]|nr:Ethylene-responsive transcription factor wri1 [Pleodorina starrii]GLC73414.1 Ethylene-responsive transcription factor wri1 [Pleodorina starrii]
MWVQMSNFDMAGAGAVPYQCIGGAEHPAAAPYAYAPMLPHWMAFGMASPVPYQYPAAVPHAYGPMCAHSTPFSMAAAVPPPQFSGDTEHPDVPYGSGVVAGTGGAVAARAADRQLDLMHQSHPQYLGVFQCPISGWWGVNIWLQGWQQQIWTYETAERAAEVYDVVALAYHGEDAVINMPLSSYAALLPLLGALDDAIEIILALRRNQQPDGGCGGLGIVQDRRIEWRRWHEAEAEAMAVNGYEAAAEAAHSHVPVEAAEAEAEAQRVVEAVVGAVLGEEMEPHRVPKLPPAEAAAVQVRAPAVASSSSAAAAAGESLRPTTPDQVE